MQETCCRLQLSNPVPQLSSAGQCVTLVTMLIVSSMHTLLPGCGTLKPAPSCWCRMTTTGTAPARGMDINPDGTPGEAGLLRRPLHGMQRIYPARQCAGAVKRFQMCAGPAQAQHKFCTGLTAAPLLHHVCIFSLQVTADAAPDIDAPILQLHGQP